MLESFEVRVNRIERTPLLKAMDDLSDAIAPYNPEEEIEIGLFRVGLPRFGDAAIRELLTNAQGAASPACSRVNLRSAVPRPTTGVRRTRGCLLACAPAQRIEALPDS